MVRDSKKVLSNFLWKASFPRGFDSKIALMFSEEKKNILKFSKRINKGLNNKGVSN